MSEQRKLKPHYGPWYAHYLQGIRDVAREHGYAIGLHGSMQTDLDLIAVPWVDEPSTGATLATAIAEAIRADSISTPESKPHGRMAWMILAGGGSFDLSVMPAHSNR